MAVWEQATREARLQIAVDELAAIPGLMLFGHWDQRRAQTGLPLHTHGGYMELVFLLKGTQVYRVDERDYPLQGGEAFVSFPGEPHSTGDSPQDASEFYWIQLDLACEENFLLLGREAAQPLLEALRALERRVLPLSAAVSGWIRESFLHLLSGGTMGRGAVLLAAALYALLDAEAAKPAVVSPCMAAVLRYAQDHVDEPLPLEELAGEAGLSLPRFKVRFKEETGLTPREYVNRLKVREAKRLLRQGMSVTETAGRLGFSTPNYFATVFRKYTTMPPSAFAGRREKP